MIKTTGCHGGPKAMYLRHLASRYLYSRERTRYKPVGGAWRSQKASHRREDVRNRYYHRRDAMVIPYPEAMPSPILQGPGRVRELEQ